MFAADARLHVVLVMRTALGLVFADIRAITVPVNDDRARVAVVVVTVVSNVFPIMCATDQSQRCHAGQQHYFLFHTFPFPVVHAASGCREPAGIFFKSPNPTNSSPVTICTQLSSK